MHARTVNSPVARRARGVSEQRRRVGVVERLRDDKQPGPEAFDVVVENALEFEDVGMGESQRTGAEKLPELFGERAMRRLEERREQYAAARRVAKAGTKPRLYE